MDWISSECRQHSGLELATPRAYGVDATMSDEVMNPVLDKSTRQYEIVVYVYYQVIVIEHGKYREHLFHRLGVWTRNPIDSEGWVVLGQLNKLPWQVSFLLRELSFRKVQEQYVRIEGVVQYTPNYLCAIPYALLPTRHGDDYLVVLVHLEAFLNLI